MALRSQAKGSSQKTAEEIGDSLEALEKLIERCKVMYEQYFLGIQKMPPRQLHRDVERKIRELTQLQIRNTSLRFRLSTLTQKFGSYNTYWRRTLREIELGTYHRHIAKVGRKAMREGEEIPEEVLASMPKLMRRRILRERERLQKKVERDRTHAQKETSSGPPNVHKIEEDPLLAEADWDLDAMFDKIKDEGAGGERDGKAAPSPAKSRPRPPAPPGPVTPPRPPAASRQTPPPIPGSGRPAAESPSRGGSLPPGMSEGQGRRLYERYVKAREQVGQKNGSMSYQKLMSTLSRQAPKIMEQHKARAVDFDVVVKGEKVVVKAKPKK